MPDLDHVSTQQFRQAFEAEFRARLALRTNLAQSIRLAPATPTPGPNRIDSSAGWTNCLMNMLIEWLSEPGAWGQDGNAFDLDVNPKYYLLPTAGPNLHGPEYLWDLMAAKVVGIDAPNQRWAAWLADPNRSRYEGPCVAVESEWGGELAQDTETALDLLVDDFYKLCDAPVKLAIFIHWEPGEQDEADLVRRVLAQTHADHRAPPTTVCIGFRDVYWHELFTTAPPIVGWLPAAAHP